MDYTPSRTRRAQPPVRRSDGANIGYTIHADHPGSAVSFRVRHGVADVHGQRRPNGRAAVPAETAELVTDCRALRFGPAFAV
jgi:hypothetical protein